MILKSYFLHSWLVSVLTTLLDKQLIKKFLRCFKQQLYFCKYCNLQECYSRIYLLISRDKCLENVCKNISTKNWSLSYLTKANVTLLSSYKTLKTYSTVIVASSRSDIYNFCIKKITKCYHLKSVLSSVNLNNKSLNSCVTISVTRLRSLMLQVLDRTNESKVMRK